MKKHTIHPLELATMTTGFHQEDQMVDDAIIMINNMMADIREGQGGLAYQEKDGKLWVSFTPFEWSLTVNVLVTDASRIAQMKAAIVQNETVLQPRLPAYQVVSDNLAKALHYGGVASTADRDAFDTMKGRIFLGPSHLHPNEYLQALGVKRVRLESVTPLYRELSA